ncbi:MAG: hypothetical protein FWF80_09065 [Defluviitaleaceae bacterium]|nr:hypothetical protein [Defluviitaleaceae bacterium]
MEEKLVECRNCNRLFNDEMHGGKCPFCVTKDENRYVKGWMVCMKGSRIGESTEIHDGETRVQIAASKTSDGDYLYLHHDHEKGETYILPNFTRGLIFVDSNIVDNIKKIEKSDNEIKINDSIFTYVHFDIKYADF